MYQPVGIQQLSNAQIKKLLSGGRVRVRSGLDHQVQLVQEHAKKLASASKKGAGIMLQLDPYARQYNSHLEGCGIGSQIKKVYKKAGKFVKGNKEAFRPLATHLKEQAHQNIADATMSALDDYNLNPTLVNAYAQLAHQSVPQGGSLKSFNKGLTKFVRSPGVKVVRKALRPIGDQLMSSANLIADQAIQQGTDQAMMGLSGMGVRRPRGRPRAGGALFPAGMGYF